MRFLRSIAILVACAAETPTRAQETAVPLGITLGHPRLVAEGTGHLWFPKIEVLPGGRLQVVCSGQPDSGETGGAFQTTSADQGRTWAPLAAWRYGGLTSWRENHLLVGLPWDSTYDDADRTALRGELVAVDGSGKNADLPDKTVRITGFPRPLEQPRHAHTSSFTTDCDGVVAKGKRMLTLGYGTFAGDREKHLKPGRDKDAYFGYSLIAIESLDGGQPPHRSPRGTQGTPSMARRFPLLVALLVGWPGWLRADLRVTTDFEGGSAIVDGVDCVNRVIEIRPGGDPARGWPCWWQLRIDGLAAGHDATLVVRGSDRPARNDGVETGEPLAPNWSLPTRAAISADGVTWRQTQPGDRGAGHVAYRLTGAGGPLWVAWGPPFASRECDELLDRAVAAAPGHSSGFELARSLEGRPVRGLRIAAKHRRRLPAVWIQARQHAWESGSSWVARGLVDWLLGDEPEAGWLRDHADVYVIPVLDVDRVATGDGGKESSPRDHNRDWTATPHYPEIAATQRQLLQLAEENRLAMFLDLHSPAPADQRPFFFVPPGEILADGGRANRDRFLMFAGRRLDAPLPLADAPRVTGSTYHPLWRQISGVWVAEHANPGTVAACLEAPWNTPHSTTAGYLDLGARLGRTLADFLRFRESQGPARGVPTDQIPR